MNDTQRNAVKWYSLWEYLKSIGCKDALGVDQSENAIDFIKAALAEKADAFTRLKDQYMALQRDKAELMKELAELREKYNELILERENGSTRAAVSPKTDFFDLCPGCGRLKAHRAEDIARGLCPKWWLYNVDAVENCKRAAMEKKEKDHVEKVS